MKYIINQIFRVFKKLTHLTFTESSYQNLIGLSFPYPSSNFSSETLLVLNTKVANFDICLYFLDGRFKQLHTLIVESESIYSTGRIPNQVSFHLNRTNRICFDFVLFVGKYLNNEAFFFVLLSDNKLLR